MKFSELQRVQRIAGLPVTSTDDYIARLEKERDTLRDELGALKAQKPVAFALYSGWSRKAVYLSESDACEQRDRRQLSADLGGSLEAYRVAPLYARPIQPAPSVPDEWKLVPIEPTQEMINHVIDERLEALVAGKEHTFIDIYKAMLAAAPKPEGE